MNTFGRTFRITTFGESHGRALGVVIDGCPPNIPLDETDIQPLLDRRRPGTSPLTSQRQEADTVEILSGVFEGKTTGTPIAMIVRNKDTKSEDYEELRTVFRPGHADFTYKEKYGIRDHRGGGHGSAALVEHCANQRTAETLGAKGHGCGQANNCQGDERKEKCSKPGPIPPRAGNVH